MQKIFKELKPLDERCYSEFKLSEDILMEHAARTLYETIIKNTKKGSKITLLCGPGNNGGDGLACARMLEGSYDVRVLLPYGAKSKMARLQLKRLEAIGVDIFKELETSDVYVDALFGSGLSKPLDEITRELLLHVNSLEGVKIACDIPTGFYLNGKIDECTFKADITVTMGALKEALFNDGAKNYIGKIVVSDLGVDRSLYEIQTSTWLLEKDDMKLPFRDTPNVNKGTYGHLALVSGEKEGACTLAALAGNAFGSGLVSIIGEHKILPLHVMNAMHLPENTTAVVAGMGLGDRYEEKELYDLLISHVHPVVIDADLFYMPLIKELINSEKQVVFTPHPKEFSALLKMADIGSYSVGEIQQNRFELAREFSQKSNAALILKGANTIVAQNGELFVCSDGEASLAKGGSGDVLAGLVGSLLAQGYEAKEAAITAVLAHAFASKNFNKNSYSLKPQDIIEGVSCL